MKKIIASLLILLVIPLMTFAEQTDLEKHQQGAIDRVNKGEKLFDENIQPDEFNVSYEGVDAETQGPRFHVTFVSNEFHNNYIGWLDRFSVSVYYNGMMDFTNTNLSYQLVDNGTYQSESVFDHAGDSTRTEYQDFYVVIINEEKEIIDGIFTFGLTRNSMQGYIMYVINEIEFDIHAVPTDDGSLIDGQVVTDDSTVVLPDDSVMDVTDDFAKTHNQNLGKIFLLIAGLGAGSVGATVLLKRKKCVTIYHQPVKAQPIQEPVKKEKTSIAQNIVKAIDKLGSHAVKGIKYVTKNINNAYTSIQKIGIDTSLGRLEIGDITGLTGADELMKINGTLNDLCDVINKKKDIRQLYTNIVDHYVNAKTSKLKQLIGKGLNVDAKKISQLININKELNVVKGFAKDGLKMEELFDLNEKIDRYKKVQTEIETISNNLNKGINIEANNFKKVLRGVR